MTAVTPRVKWPVDDRIRARVARRYFVDQATKVEIGAEFGLTRFQVAKVVQDCLDDGTVVITVHGPEHVDDELSERLASRFGLADALVTDDLAGASRYVVAMLASRLDDGDVLALAGGGVVDAALAAARGLPACEVVQARGVTGLADHGIELVKRVAGACGGEAYPIYAPFRSRHPADAATLRAHPLVEVALGRLDRVACAVLGADDLPGVDDEHTIGITAGQLRRAPFVVLADAGPDRVGPMATALRGGLVHAVVTDVLTATALAHAAGAHPA